MTHLQAKELFKAGKIDQAWIVAQQDDGWLGTVTKAEWIKWMNSLV